jgi:hypothetical protein
MEKRYSYGCLFRPTLLLVLVHILLVKQTVLPVITFIIISLFLKKYIIQILMPISSLITAVYIWEINQIAK